MRVILLFRLRLRRVRGFRLCRAGEQADIDVPLHDRVYNAADLAVNFAAHHAVDAHAAAD